jgi:hypothetical protein
MTKLRYGIISDIHENPKNIEPAIHKLKDLDAQKIIANGDLGTGQDQIANTISKLANSGLETYILPGSHENINDFEPVVHYFSEKSPNIINTSKVSKVSNNNHDLVFLPGSDFLCGGEYKIISSSNTQTGFYKDQRGLPTRLTNMRDLETKVSDPEKTVVICHVPRKFYNPKFGVDMAHFHQGRIYHKDKNDMSLWTYTELCVAPGVIPRKEIEKLNSTKAFSLDDSDEYVLNETLKIIDKENVNRWQVFVERKDNRGNENLKDLYEKLGIKKAVTGHFHESVHRAHDSKCSPIQHGQKTKELFWNASYLDGNKLGILEVEDNLVSYENIYL